MNPVQAHIKIAAILSPNDPTRHTLRDGVKNAGVEICFFDDLFDALSRLHSQPAERLLIVCRPFTLTESARLAFEQLLGSGVHFVIWQPSAAYPLRKNVSAVGRISDLMRLMRSTDKPESQSGCGPDATDSRRLKEMAKLTEQELNALLDFSK